jgi:hypothetical protein
MFSFGFPNYTRLRRRINFVTVGKGGSAFHRICLISLLQLAGWRSGFFAGSPSA